MKLKLTQLIDDNNGNETKSLEWGEWVNYNYDWLLSKSGLRTLSTYIAGIGMNKSRLVDETGKLLLPELVNDAHNLGLVVHAYTFRREKESLPSYAPGFEALLDYFYFKVGVDGVFTDYCGDAVLFLHARPAAPASAPAAEAVGGESPQPVVAPDAPRPPEAVQVFPATPASAPEIRLPASANTPVAEPPVSATAPKAPSGPAAPRLPITISGPELVPKPASSASEPDPAESKYR
jgi:hypothetical protein